MFHRRCQRHDQIRMGGDASDNRTIVMLITCLSAKGLSKPVQMGSPRCVPGTSSGPMGEVGAPPSGRSPGCAAVFLSQTPEEGGGQ